VTVIFRWEDPPPPPEKKIVNPSAEIARMMRERPGKWAKIGEYLNKGTASQRAKGIRQGRPGIFAPAGSFEATSRDTSVWARYVGNPGGPDEDEDEGGEFGHSPAYGSSSG
jgi:hypothetical protein